MVCLFRVIDCGSFWFTGLVYFGARLLSLLIAGVFAFKLRFVEVIRGLLSGVIGLFECCIIGLCLIVLHKQGLSVGVYFGCDIELTLVIFWGPLAGLICFPVGWFVDFMDAALLVLTGIVIICGFANGLVFAWFGV